MSSKTSPSFVEYECKQCHKKIQKRSLDDHYTKFHPNHDHKECLIHLKSNLHGFFKRPHETDIQSESNKLPKISNVPSSSSASDEVLHEVSSVDLQAVLKNQDKMMNMLTSLTNQKVDLDKKKSTSTHELLPKSANVNDEDVVFDVADSVEFLMKNIDWLVPADRNPSLANCIACADPKKIQIGVFDCDQEFNKFKFVVKRHAKLESHLLKINERNLSNEESMKTAKRNELVGMRLGSLCYQILYEGESLRSYPKKVALLSTNGVDCGTTNHSRRFIVSLIPHFKEEISDMLKAVINTTLESTDELRPCALIDDKTKLKHDERHGILCRIPILKQGRFFKY